MAIPESAQLSEEMTISYEQAQMLIPAMTMPGIVMCEATEGSIARFNDLLKQSSSVAGEVSPVVVPRELSSTAIGCAKLVLNAELEIAGAIVKSGRTRELAARIQSGRGFENTFNLLAPIIEIQSR